MTLAVCLAAAAPSPNAPSPAQSSHQKASQDERGTEALPFIVKVLESEKTGEQLAKEKAEEDAKAASDEALVGFTSDLAHYTLGLFIATMVLAAVTFGLVVTAALQLRDTRKTIIAMQASVDAIKLTEMARIMVTKITLPDLRPGKKSPKFRVHFHNFGKTPGFIHRTTLHFAPAERNTALESLIPGARGGSYENGFPIPPTEIAQPAVDDDGKPLATPESGKPATDQYGIEPITAQEIAELTDEKGKLQLFVWGAVEFSPVFDERWISEFAYRVNLRPKAEQKCVAVGGANHWRYYKADNK